MAQISLSTALQRLQTTPAVLVTVLDAQGSVPRGPGTRMLVFADDLAATIGGGHLEFQAMAHARVLLAGADGPVRLRLALGPSLGQCCGGAVSLGFECVGAQDAGRLQALLTPSRQPLARFGGGHVGHALVQVLALLPFALRWIDSRDGIFPDPVPTGVVCEHSNPVQSAVDVVIACLRRIREHDDLPFVGLIGSKTKWATFRRRLQERGFSEGEMARITCPIGVPGITGKEPEVIAVAVAAQLLQDRSQQERSVSHPQG
jgi:xanthine dehydrogenase accessory factor